MATPCYIITSGGAGDKGNRNRASAFTFLPGTYRQMSGILKKCNHNEPKVRGHGVALKLTAGRRVLGYLVSVVSFYAVRRTCGSTEEETKMI
jgi:hypothetical protein